MAVILATLLLAFLGFFGGVLWLGARQGEDPDEGEHVTLHFLLDFQTEASARSAAEALRQRGFEDVEVGLEEDGEAAVAATLRGPWRHAEADRRAEEVEALAEQYGGELGFYRLERDRGAHLALALLLIPVTGILFVVAWWLTSGSMDPVPVGDDARAAMPPSWFAAWLATYLVLVANRRRLARLFPS